MTLPRLCFESSKSLGGFFFKKIGRKTAFHVVIDYFGLLVVHYCCVIKHKGGQRVKD